MSPRVLKRLVEGEGCKLTRIQSTGGGHRWVYFVHGGTEHRLLAPTTPGDYRWSLDFRARVRRATRKEQA